MGSSSGSSHARRARRGEAGADAAPVCELAAERLRLAALGQDESSARAAGYRWVAGLDEVGRGCLAGPVFAGAVVLDPEDPIAGIDDSKVLAPEVREDLAERIGRRAAGAGLGMATAAEIDALGIVTATQLAMRRALLALETAAGQRPDFLLLDAMELPLGSVPQRSLIRGDARVGCIAAASIVAKVARDRFMTRLHRFYPHYGFEAHKGYGTLAHRRALARYGPSPEHRLTFGGVLPAVLLPGKPTSAVSLTLPVLPGKPTSAVSLTLPVLPGTSAVSPTLPLVPGKPTSAVSPTLPATA